MRGRYVAATWKYDGDAYVPPRHRRPCRYKAFIPDEVGEFNDALAAELAGVVADAEEAVRALNDRARPALKPLARLLLRTESIASSKVEGLQVGTRALARAEAAAEAGKHIGATANEVLANVDAMELAIEESSVATDLALAHIVAIQKTLMSRAPNSHIAGKLRTTQNWIGGNDYNPCGAQFVPPPPDDLDRLLADLCRLSNSTHLPPLIQAAVAHAQFETIHPFDDGNGRTGRALIHILLRRRGLAPSYVPPISVVFARARDRYIEGLERYREGDVQAWLERFATAAADSAMLAQKYLKRVNDLQERWRERLHTHVNPRADAAAWAVIDLLPGHPVITVPVAVAVSGRSKSSTTIAVDQLVDAGVLSPFSQSKRNRAYEAVGLLDLVEGLETGR